MDKSEVLETLKAANLYLNHLNCLEGELENALEQIDTTFRNTEKNISETFSNLKDELMYILKKREKFLLDKAKKTESESLAPLQECRCIILNKIESTNKLIKIGNSIIDGVNESVDTFVTNASKLGSLPEVPDLKEVPYLSFHYEQSSEVEVKDILSQFGYVCRIAPIQVTDLSEKPGALLIEWRNVEIEERMTDIQEFRLQRAFGDVVKDKHLVANFKDCYKGLDTQFLVKDLLARQPYSFRVCCKFEGTSEWSPWSLPQVSSTSLKHFSWKPNEDYIISNENRIAAPKKSVSKILISDGAQFSVGHSVEFTFLEVDSSEALVGLIWDNLQNDMEISNLMAEGCFVVNSNGKIYVDGSEKSTVLPNFTKGLKVCFTCDLVNNQKVRVNIDSNEKRVTYDWPVNPDSKMLFVAHFCSNKWKIMVE
ncbi:cytokine receptor-like factor 3 [Leptinotarsa decemlineata]|uniref:cytokine receptor-like factor 3 n=1 Tax=Leptinotarsa decemlineata TaxID=7539 RepID=UPI003D307A63